MNGLDITTDPHPEYPTHEQWDKLLQTVQSIIPGRDGEIINRALYMVRGVGATLERKDGRMKIVPLYEPDGRWRNEAELKEWAVPTLTRFKDEVKKCLDTIA